MDSKFHQIAPIIALRYMPAAFRNFLVTMGEFTEKRIGEIACYPDLLDHDNLTQNPEIHHAHSYKLDEHGKWLDGDCIKTIEGLSAFILDAWREYKKLNDESGKMKDEKKSESSHLSSFISHPLPAWPLLWLVRYALAKVTHYRIDALTYPHLHKGMPWSHYHTSFEAHMDGAIKNYELRIKNGEMPLGEFVFDPYKHVYRDCRQAAIEAWERGKGLVERLEDGGKFTDEDFRIAGRICIQGVGDLWLTLAVQMGLA